MTILEDLYYGNQKDGSVLESIRPEFKVWKSKGYQPVVFRSGNADLEDSLYGLMKHNYMLEAKRRADAEAAAIAKAKAEAATAKEYESDTEESESEEESFCLGM